MVTESATATFEKLELDCGVTLAPVEVAYETYGALNAGANQRHPGAARFFRRRACGAAKAAGGPT